MHVGESPSANVVDPTRDPNMSMRIYTKTGDKGDTGLFGGQRVSKDALRVEVYGTVDELNAALGLAVALGDADPLAELLGRLQALLFELGAELATPPGAKRSNESVVDADVTGLEQAIDAAEAELSPLKTFILPGGGTRAAALHLARTVCRRAERLCVTLRREEPETREITVRFLNRLADLLFVLARRATAEAGRADVAWSPRGG
jgi:cob(I)alamin adenosyltransferase